MRSALFDPSNIEPASGERFTLLHNKMLRVALGAPVLAKKGSMVAYQGQVEFQHKSAGGIGKFLKQQLSGEDTDLMTVAGSGEVFFAENASNIFLIDLDGDDLSVNAANLLALDATLDYDVHRVQGAGALSGGAFNTRVAGSGTVAVMTEGQPVLLDCSTPTAVDINAAVCWSANLTPSIRSSVNMRSMLRGGTGEAFQYVFQGPGFVVVQPSEGPVVPPHSHGSNGGRGGGGLADLLGG